MALTKQIAEGGGAGNRLAESLGALPEAVRAEIDALAHTESVPAGTVLVAEGAQAADVGYVLEGTLAMRKLLVDGREHIIGLLVPGDLFGRVFDGPSGYDVVALTDVRVVRLARAGFEGVLRRAPEVERAFLVTLLDELDAAHEWILMLNGQKVIERVASFLLILLRRKDPAVAGRPPVLTLPLSRANLAHYLGTRPETLSRALHELEDRGAVRIRDPYLIEIADTARLAAIAGPDLVYDGE